MHDSLERFLEHAFMKFCLIRDRKSFQMSRMSKSSLDLLSEH